LRIGQDLLKNFLLNPCTTVCVRSIQTDILNDRQTNQIV